METIAIAGSICSVVSLILNLFLISQVYQIKNNINISGRNNVVAGRDATKS